MPSANIDRLRALHSAAERDLRENILPFWSSVAGDNERGGFYGRVWNDRTPDPNETKGCVLNARILWSFSAVYNRWPEPRYLELATRAYDYLVEHFWDKEHSGLVWMVVTGALGASLVGKPGAGSAARVGRPADRHVNRRKCLIVFMGVYSFSRFCISLLIISLCAPADAVSEPAVDVAAAAFVEVEAGVSA